MSSDFLVDMTQIKGSIDNALAGPEQNPILVHSLLQQFITTRDRALEGGGVRVANLGALMLAKIVPSMFKSEEVAAVCAPLYFDQFETTMRAVFNIASDVKGEHRDTLVAMGVDNLIHSDAFRTDPEPIMTTSLIRNLIGHCTDKAPAFKFCEAILHQVNTSSYGAWNIIEAAFDITLTKSLPDKDPSALLGWIGDKEVLIASKVPQFSVGATTKERVDLFREAGLQTLANQMYLRSKMLDSKELIRLNKAYGLRPDERYISQFFSTGNPEMKHLRELLKYSLVVENVFPADFDTRQPWVVTSLVDAFKRLRESGIQPKAPADCQALFAVLSRQVKPTESVEPLMTKMISPYLKGSMDLRTKMFTQALGV